MEGFQRASQLSVVWLQYSGSCIHIANFATVYNLHECHLHYLFFCYIMKGFFSLPPSF